MNSTPAELLKSYVNSQKFTSTTEVMGAMKDMFRDVIQHKRQKLHTCERSKKREKIT